MSATPADRRVAKPADVRTPTEGPAPIDPAVLDQTLVRVDRADLGRFMEILDRPASGPGFERLMGAPKPWGG